MREEYLGGCGARGEIPEALGRRGRVFRIAADCGGRCKKKQTYITTAQTAKAEAAD